VLNLASRKKRRKCENVVLDSEFWNFLLSVLEFSTILASKSCFLSKKSADCCFRQNCDGKPLQGGKANATEALTAFIDAFDGCENNG
jgi:hypothetical protein